ncbi:MAG: hypothetical protein H0V69_05690 [Acidimicrobiia bacterium]|nr:hypothetical protein [Acidimicrobiia bacterium]
MDEQLTRKLTLVGWLALAGYEAFALAAVIGALTVGEKGAEVAKRDRLYQLAGLANPIFIGLVLLAALIGIVVLTRSTQPESQARLLVTAAMVTAAVAALLAIAVAISFATDDRRDDRWSQTVAALAGLPVSAAVLLLPLRNTSPSPSPSPVRQTTPPPPPRV